MSTIDALIAELCPEGVECKRLDEVGVLFNGLTGKSKADFTNGNARFVTYMNVFTNNTTDVSPHERVRVSEGERQNRVHYGDVLFTASSESADEVGMASAVTVEPPEALYLNSFCFGFRPNEAEKIDPEFAKHLFRSKDIRRQIIKTANGVTRINVSKDRFRSIKIPVPPMEVQREIVSILNKMEKLQAELQAELQTRSRQYEFYRDDSLDFTDSPEVQWIPMGDLLDALIDHRGKTPKKLGGDWTPAGHRVVSALNIKNGAVDSNEHHYISSEMYGKWMRTPLQKGDLLLTSEAPLGSVANIDHDVDWAIGQRLFALRPKAAALSSRFLFHLLAGGPPRSELLGRATGSTVSGIRQSELVKVLIPVPPLAEQERIVAILDRFDVLVNDLSVGLPAEIAARRQQYEYYRDKLLTFPERPDAA